MTNLACKKLDDLLGKHLTPVLTNLGFEKANTIYTADLGDVIWFIDIQKSIWNAQDELKFTLNCGVYVRGVWSKFATNLEAGKEDPNPRTCAISARLGMLTSERIDSWWTLSSGDEEDIDLQTVNELLRMIEDLLFPFFDKFHTPLDVAEFLSCAPDDQTRCIYPLARSIRLAYAGIIYFNLGETLVSERLIDSAIIEDLKNFENAEVIENLKSRLFVN